MNCAHVTPRVKPHNLGSARGYPWEAPSPNDLHLSVGGQGVLWFGLVRFGSGWFGLVRGFGGQKKGAKNDLKKVRGARLLVLLLKQHRLLVRQGSVWFSVAWRGAAAKKGAKRKLRIFCCGTFGSGSAGFGRVRRGLVGLQT